MSRWFRVYDDLVDDPKVQRLPGDIVKALLNLWCLASQNDGLLPAADDIAFKLRMKPARVEHLLSVLGECGLIDSDETGLHPHNWVGRQFKSDVSNERVKRHRNAKRNVTPTVTATPPDTEQIQNRTERAADAAPSGAVEPIDEDPKAKLFRIGKTILVSFGVAEKRTGALIGQWLKNRNDPEGLLGAIQFAREQNVADPVAYISALLNRAKPNGHHGKQDLSAMCFAIADELRQQERAGGDDRSDELFGSR